MAYLEITNFKFGLDERRSELTSQIGSLDTLNNAHVNEGGECEKRRAFFPMNDQSFLSNGKTLGFNAESGGLVVFGDTVAPSYSATNSLVALQVAIQLNLYGRGYRATVAGAVITLVHSSGGNIGVVNNSTTAAGTITVTNNNTASVTITIGGVWANTESVAVTATVAAVPTIGFISLAAMPTAFTAYAVSSGGGTTPAIKYQQLVHPYAAYGVVPTISRIVESCTFANQSFVIAQYSDASTILFYNGTAVVDSYAGLMTTLVSGSSSAVLQVITNQIVAWTPTQATGYTAENVGIGNSHQFRILATAGNFTATVTTTSAAGTVTVDNAVAGNVHVFTVGGTWVAGDQLTISLLNNGVTSQVGYGSITGIAPTFCFTFGAKVYLLLGAKAYFSAVGSGSFFNGPDGTGNGYMDLSSFSGTNDFLVAAAPYQGKCAFFFRHSVQIWNLFADDSQNTLAQTLSNIGLVSSRAVQPIGELDVLFVSDSGIRSLRVRDSSLNAYTIDIGSPINDSIRALLAGRQFFPYQLNSTKIVMGYEPTNNRVIVSLPDSNGLVNMFTLSYFPQSKISAWATYDFTWNYYSTTQVAMTVEKFITFNGALYGRGTESGTGSAIDAVIVYDPSLIQRTAYLAAFDNCTVTIATPWMSGKTPGTNKVGRSVDVASAGKWTISASMDPKGATMDQTSSIGSTTNPVTTQDSTFDVQSFSFQATGTHFRLLATCTAAIQATLSSFVFHFKEANEKP